MSFASILSGPSDEQPAKPSPQPSSHAVPHPSSIDRHHHPESGPIAGTFYPKAAKGQGMEFHHVDPSKGSYAPNGLAGPGPEPAGVIIRAPQRKPFPPGVDAEQVNRAVAEIDEAEKSDLEGPGFDGDREQYHEKQLKRSLEGSHAEQVRRKVCFNLTWPRTQT